MLGLMDGAPDADGCSFLEGSSVGRMLILIDGALDTGFFEGRGDGADVVGLLVLGLEEGAFVGLPVTRLTDGEEVGSSVTGLEEGRTLGMTDNVGRCVG